MTFPHAHHVLMHFTVFTVLILSLTEMTRAGPGTGTLFGTDANAGHLLRLNPTTGAATLVGSIGFAAPALAIDPATGIVYVGRGAGFPALYSVNPDNGTAILVGDTGLGFAAIGSLEFSSSGALYAAVNLAGDGGTGSDHLALIDKSTGVATVIGSFGTCRGVVVPTFGGGTCTIQGIEAIAFDATGTLWGAKDARGPAGPAGMYKIDPATGKATFVSPILNAFSIPPSGGITSLQFGCDGTLYGGTARAIATSGDGGRLVTINPATGVFSFTGAFSATTGSSLAGLAFDHSCPAIDIKP
ncbi:MAG TPA: hypothetical protein VH369_18955, partial [Bryobacteraceae bacterium]